MSENLNKIRSIKDLDKAIALKKNKARELEDRINNRFEYLQEHYPSLVKNSIFKITLGGDSPVGSIINTILGHDRIQKTMNNALGTLGEKFADWIERLTDKMSKKS